MEIHEIEDHIIVAAMGICENKKTKDLMLVSIFNEEDLLDEYKQKTVKILTARAKRMDAAIKGLKELLR